MAAQPFESIAVLLPQVEGLVLEAHRRWYEAQGHRDWSRPKAYHWLHYEDPDPIARLREGVLRLGGHVALDEEALSGLENQMKHRRGA